MKYKFLSFIQLFLLLIFLVSCSEERKDHSNEKNAADAPFPKEAKFVTPLNTINLTEVQDGEFFFPKFSPAGDKVFFTSANFNGIWYVDLKSNKIQNVTEDKSAGYGFEISNDGKNIFYLTRFSDDGRRVSKYSLIEKDITTGNSKELFVSSKWLTPPRLVDENKIAFYEDDELILLNTSTAEKLEKKNHRFGIFIARENKIIFTSNIGERQIEFPEGNNIIWVEQSPFEHKALAYVVGKGVFIVDSTGESKKYLGDYRAAKWSPMYNLITFMVDKDNGHFITEVDIFVTTISGDSYTINLTQTPEIIEMNPAWSPDGKKIVFNTYSGEIKLIELKIEEQEKQ
jgi:hypothetical protein